MSWPATPDELETLGQAIVANSAGAITAYHVAFDELTVHAPLPRIVQALTELRDHPDYRFQQLIDLAGADYPERERRFDVVYHLLSLTKNRRIRVKIQTDEDTPVPTVTGVFPCADWYERETFDMYGVRFDGHPNLKRIYLYEQFEGHPLRMDYPKEKRQPLIGPGAVHRDPMNDDLTPVRAPIAPRVGGE